MRYQICISALPLMFCAVAGAATPTKGSTALVGVMETTDLHSNVLGYDYFKLAPEPSLGLDRTAALIAQARQQFPNNLLFDNGDAIQGSALADYQALAHPLKCDQTLAIYKVMNKLGYDGGGIGNHEFNYGLAYLSQVTGNRFEVDGVDASRPRCAGPAFPQVLANVYSLKTRQPLFAPYRIIDKQITAQDADGKPLTVTLKVGIIGFAPPTILSWDKRSLEGKVYTEGLRETASRFIPEMRAQGADLVVAISHGGLDDSAYQPSMENGNWHLSKVPGIDAMLIGHSHLPFPNASSTIPQFNLPGVDKVKGLVNGVPTVMANLWGKHLGVIGLHLSHDGQRWIVDRSQTTVEARAAQQAGKSFIAPDPAIAALVAGEHEATIGYVKTPVGATDFRMSTYFADVGDVTAIAVVNLAQADYVSKYVKANLPQYAALPVLSMASPFKGGSAGVSDYTDVKAGSLALNNAADLYLYPNSLYAVKVNGGELKAWLEHAAGRFNTIDPELTTPQELVNTAFPTYNFDAMTSKEISYEIDVSKVPGQRIKNLRFRDKAVTASNEFLVATNNYRASGGGGFPGLDGSKTAVAAPDANRDVLIGYIKEVKNLTRAESGQQRSWRFARVRTAGPVVFHSAPGLLPLARQAGLANVSQLRADDGLGKGFALYAVDLSK
ncbi:bifunctional 2',3'-cyclic-nucleotide 2'-phosphodiesterase/3'-nucleotidase [Massilia genomosp. 1]|uniref:Bifunctional 2',3'-cyclic-nucleotide 2'-phosphodiesterase/3'-nucleotidase n=1 Tax=Massilia genomosp. 1 TaxID=2609280 RepID=A0ABX0MWU9_9BURK|nr:bifunctional 2',3'-cyclic-nucleotide 2'-phosphodiesterase/3'-nucleotidase [Massilia genomosp. 1]NHZ64533.1 bifunctional 2',3'-cyclic-nucleotide 2'-phosphodiesterase/3'-nucleotidase [Massilia genomosp. 1]